MDRTTVLASGAIIRSPDRTSPKFWTCLLLRQKRMPRAMGLGLVLCARLPARQHRFGHLRAPGTGRDRGPDEARRSTGEACVESICRSGSPGLSLVVNVLDPDILVIGGGMANITELYDDLPGRLAEETFSPCFYTPPSEQCTVTPVAYEAPPGCGDDHYDISERAGAIRVCRELDHGGR